MERLKLNKPVVEKVYGLVLQENIPSLKIFNKLNYEKRLMDNGIIYFEKYL
jgi:hypothetical protein